MKPLLIGEAPGPNGDPEKPLEGNPGLRLLDCMHVPSGPEQAGAELIKMFDVRNVIERPLKRPEGQKGTEWPAEEAAEAARRLALLFERGQHVVFLGKRVAAAFGFQDPPFWEWALEYPHNFPSSPVLVVIPHPSGIVRLWNDPINRARAGMVLWQAMGKIPR